jgi:hypothetical protein
MMSNKCVEIELAAQRLFALNGFRATSILAILRVNVRVSRHKQNNDASKYPIMEVV